ncbi:MAG: UDP-N-acetylglucosamine 2-epimerase (non-hydrolyzing) [Acidobacteria bacterium]|nr:UDP-N-acetylglucosamine 2-epimerase (non-hydrolyzing) [Acidobacteriota bacterium]
MKIDLIVGARPNFMKIAPIAQAMDTHKDKLSYRLVHTGQHYDHTLSDAFFRDLGIPTPDVNLGVGSGSQAEQTANIMVRYERLLNQHRRPDMTLVVGDVNSTLACAIVAKKRGLKLAHVEAGLRSFDWTMPEEINRVATDALCDLFFTTLPSANENLKNMGIADDQIMFVGNPMIDTLLGHRSRFKAPDFWDVLQLQPKGFITLTLHRPANVDDTQSLCLLLEEICKATTYPIIFPIHPRTRKNLPDAFQCSHLHPCPPLSYLEFNYLVENSACVVTDSGGISEETTILNVPCLTLRPNTERPETVTMGTNELCDRDNVAERIGLALSGQWKKGSPPPLWDGEAGDRIVAHLLRWSK